MSKYFDPKITVGNILQMILMVCMFCGWLVYQERRNTVMEMTITNHDRRLTQLEDVAKTMAQVQVKVADVQAKVARILNEQ